MLNKPSLIVTEVPLTEEHKKKNHYSNHRTIDK